jgi:hypothetical protein
LLRILRSLDELFGVEFQDLKDGLGVLRIVVFGEGGRSEQFLPFYWQTDESPAVGVEAYVYPVSEVGGVADTTHAGASLIDAVDPRVDIVVGLDFACDDLGGAIAGWGGAFAAVEGAGDFKGKRLGI